MKTLQSNPRMTYKDATEDDLVSYYGQRPPYSIKAIIFYLDGQVAGIGGWKIQNHRYVVFSEIAEGVKLEKTTIYRCGKIIMGMIAEKGCPMHAASDNPKLLQKLGFKPFETVSDNKEFFVWQC